jgi:hypothetical protein
MTVFTTDVHVGDESLFGVVVILQEGRRSRWCRKNQMANVYLVGKKQKDRKRMLNVTCQPEHSSANITIRLTSRNQLR